MTLRRSALHVDLSAAGKEKWPGQQTPAGTPRAGPWHTLTVLPTLPPPPWSSRFPESLAPKRRSSLVASAGQLLTCTPAARGRLGLREAWQLKPVSCLHPTPPDTPDFQGVLPLVFWCRRKEGNLKERPLEGVHTPSVSSVFTHQGSVQLLLSVRPGWGGGDWHVHRETEQARQTCTFRNVPIVKEYIENGMTGRWGKS